MATTSNATNITSLPIELVQTIAHEGDRSDILNLRLVCRDISAKVDDVFIDTFFKKRRHLITAYSLNALVGICGDARLRRKLQSLEFVAAELNESPYKPADDFDIYMENELLRFRLFDEGFHKLCEADQNKANEAKQNEIILGNESRRNVWGRWIAERDRLDKDGLAVALMSDALTSLARAGIIPSLWVHSNVDELQAVRPYGFQSVQRYLNLASIGPVNHDNIFESPYGHSRHSNTAVTYLLKALATAAFPATQLTLLDYAETFSIDCFNLDHALLPGIQSAFRNLNTLELSLKSGPIWQTQDALSSFARIMQAAINLSVLNIKFHCESCNGPSPPQKDMVHLAEALPKNRLKTIKVFYGKFRADDFLTLFEHHSKSLRRVEVFGTAMPDVDQWRAVLRRLASNLSLEKVSMQWLHVCDWTIHLREDQQLVISGVEKVKESLEDLAQNAVFEWDG